MGEGGPGVRSVTDSVDRLTGLASADHLRSVMRAALEVGERLPLAVVVADIPQPSHPIELARRLTLAGAMARGAFGSALAVGRLGSHRVGVLSGRDPALGTRVDLLARMVGDLPSRVRVIEPVSGSPQEGDLLLRDLCQGPL